MEVIMNKIGEGRSAEIFDLGDKVIMVFRDTYPKHGVEFEYKCHKLAYENGAIVPKVYEMTEYEGRPGIVYEKITGDSLKNLFMSDFNKYKDTYDEYAKSLKSVHNIKTDELGNCDYVERISQLDMDEDLKKRVIEKIKDYPKGEHLLHGDFHPDNVLVDDKIYIIDWEGAKRGHPCEDVARSLMLFDTPYGLQGVPWYFKPLVKFMIKQYKNNFLESYLKDTPYTKEDVDMWLLPIYTLRLREKIPFEEKWLIKNIKRLL